VISPYRLYSFWLASDSTGFNVSWEDHWYNQFEMKDMVVSSNNYPMTNAFPLPMYTYTARSATDGSSVANQTRNPYIPALGLNTAVSVGAVAPALLGITADFTYFEAVEKDSSGHYVGVDSSEQAELSIAVDVARGQEILWDYALTFDAVPPTMVPVGSNPVTLPFPGDYRRPGNAPLTGMLTDDELWAVAHLAGSIGVPGPTLLGILLELTGARRNAYHPAGYYGISNLTPVQVAAGGMPAQVAAGGIADMTDFVNASVHRQLAVTAQYLSTLKPPVSGMLPVFFTLATGTPQPSVTATTTTSLPVGGVPMTAGQATQRINKRASDIQHEFNTRLPASVTPIIGVTG
jgi:hypothetical protein